MNGKTINCIDSKISVAPLSEKTITYPLESESVLVSPEYYTDVSSEPIYDYERIFEEMAKRFSRVPKMAYKCHSCGGELEIKPDQAIFKCPYCKTCYAIGTNMVNWK